MDKVQFNYLVKNFTSLNNDEAQLLPGLLKDYSYSQLIHHLVARAHQDNNLPEKDTYLHVSAVYSTDRTVLRSIMTEPKISRSTVGHEISEEATYVPPTAIHDNKVGEMPTLAPNMDDDLYEQVASDLDDLRKSKQRFEEVLAQLEDQSLNISEAHDPEEGLIEEIKQQAKKRTKVDPKQKEQAEIIDKFIKAQPAMPKPKANVAPAADLTEKSTTLGKDVISETLVDLLIKQGKKEKATEMLKKLIWKFPQKKAYFAARIQELK